MDWGFGTPGRPHINDFRSEKSKNIWEVSQVFFGGNFTLLKSSQNIFPMVRVIHFRSFSSFFCEIWALLKSFKNDFPMVRVKNLRSFSSFFFLKNDPPGKSWKTYFSGIPWTLGPSGPSLDSRAQNSVQDSLNESSVRPNGTPVMPVLRSRSTVKKTIRRKTWSGG